MRTYLSELAAEQLTIILDYLEIYWSEKVRDNFMKKMENTILTIDRFPKAFPESKKYSNIRKAVITPQTVAYYQIVSNAEEEEIEIITIIDTRIEIDLG